MEQKRPSIPMQVQAFRRRRWRPRWPWVLAAALVALLLIWLVSRTPGESSAPSRAPVSTAQVAGPPWQMGNPEGRFTLTLYADLECPFCREYFPQLKRWVGNNTDVALQWHHQPLAAHEPAASAEARLAECAAEAGGHAAFWQAVEWVYAHTRSDGQGVPNLEAFPGMSKALKTCMSGEESARIVQAQAGEATASGITATPSLRLVDRTSGRSLVLPGPVPGDSLLSAIDMLATNDPAEAKATVSPDTPASAEDDTPR